MSTVSVIVVSYRTAQLTAAAASSALACSSVVEVIVVDNAADHSTAAAIDRLADDRLTLIVNPANLGFGTAANLGAASATAPELIFLNSDATISDEACNAIIAELVRHGGRCIVGPRMIGLGEAIQHSVGLLPRPGDLLLRGLGLHQVAGVASKLPLAAGLIAHLPIAREYRTAVAATSPTDVTMVSGACFAVGREAFAELGGFDERFFMYFEDADLCRRAAAAGMPIRYVPSAVVSHIGGASSSNDYHFGPLHARSMRQYLDKWYGPGGSAVALVLLWLRAVGFSIALRPQASRAWRALWAALRDEDARR